MSLLTPSQSVSHKQFHQCVKHKNRLSWSLLPTSGIFSFFQASLWLRVKKVLQKLSKSDKSELSHLFQCWFPENVRLKPHFNTQWKGGGGYKIRKLVTQESTYTKKSIESGFFQRTFKLVCLGSYFHLLQLYFCVCI